MRPVKVLELVELLTGRGELHGLVRDRLDGEGRTATRVAVELREDDAVEVDPLRECLGHGNRVLAGHGIEDEEDVVRLQLFADGGELVHELLVDVEPAGESTMRTSRPCARAWSRPSFATLTASFVERSR